MIITVASSPIDNDRLSASAEIIHGHQRQRHMRRRYHGDAGLEATFSISAEIRASPVVTLLKVKAEISTKCAARTIKVPFICSGPG